MSGLRITSARLWNARAVGRILATSVREQDWLENRLTAADYRIAAGRMIRFGWVRVAKRNGRIVGFIAVQTGEVEALYIDPRHRGQGVGAALLASAKSSAERLTLRAHAANYAARRFYTAQGFRAVAFSDANDDCVTDIQFVWEPVT